MKANSKYRAALLFMPLILMSAAGLYAQPAPTPDDLLSLPPVEGALPAPASPENEGLSLPPAPLPTGSVPGQPPIQPIAGDTAGVASPVPPSPQASPASPPPQETPAPAEPSNETTLNALLPDPLDIVTDTNDTGFKPSYGSWPYSIMYPSTEITNLKNILALYERKGFLVDVATPAQQPAAPSVEEIYQKLQEAPLPPNLVYPSFKLRSILYHNANDWSVWLNNRLITHESNNSSQEITVVRITKDWAEFAWVPTNAELLSAILRIRLLPEGSRPPTAETPQHRKVTYAATSEGWLDKSTSVVHFILRPNQVFYSETFEVFEGTPSSLTATIDRAIQLETSPDTSSAATGDDPTKIIKDLQKQLEAAQQGQAAAPPPQAPSAPNTNAEDHSQQKQNPKAQMMRTLGFEK